jgi:hypothetical protein
MDDGRADLPVRIDATGQRESEAKGNRLLATGLKTR